MTGSLGRVALVASLLASVWYVGVQGDELVRARAAHDQMSFHYDLVSGALKADQRQFERLKAREPHLLHRLARRQGYLLPGEIDWWVLERHNALRWPEIWGTMDVEERR